MEVYLQVEYEIILTPCARVEGFHSWNLKSIAALVNVIACQRLMERLEQLLKVVFLLVINIFVANDETKERKPYQ